MSVGGRQIPAWALAVLMVASIAIPTATAQSTWVTYSNARFGTTVEYPVDWFRNMAMAPENDDGRVFLAPDGAQLIVSAGYNALGHSLEEHRDFVVANLPAGSTVTYAASKSDWFVVSGLTGDEIFYERHLMGPNDIIHSLVIRVSGGAAQLL